MCTLNISPLRVEECERAAELGRPMFAVVWPEATGGFKSGGLARFPWRIVFKISREEDLEKVAEVKGGKKPDSPFFSNFRGVPQTNLQISGQFCRKNYF